jgi:hypothetical protein
MNQEQDDLDIRSLSDEDLSHTIANLGKLTNKPMAWDYPERHAWEERYYWNRGAFEQQRELWRRLRRERRRRERAFLKTKKMSFAEQYAQLRAGELIAVANATCLPDVQAAD